MFEELTLKKYNEILSSNAPTPGGGSALCQVGALACSLIEMAINVTVAKLPEDDKTYLLGQRDVTARAKRAFFKLSNDDAAAFERIVNALRMPKLTDEDKTTRNYELQKAYHRAALVPLDVMNLCRELVRMATVRIQPLLGKYVASDCTIAVDLLKAVAKNSMLNVRANTTLIADKELAANLDRQGNAILAEVERG